VRFFENFGKKIGKINFYTTLQNQTWVTPPVCAYMGTLHCSVAVPLNSQQQTAELTAVIPEMKKMSI
jgi:hypothetical protein